MRLVSGLLFLVAAGFQMAAVVRDNNKLAAAAGICFLVVGLLRIGDAEPQPEASIPIDVSGWE